MYIDQNIDKLRNKFPLIKWNELLKLENSLDNRTDIEPSRKGLNTIKISINNTVSYLHSKYDPLAEAKMIVDSLELESDDRHFLFYGIGLGYVLDVIRDMMPDMTYSIYEPNALVFIRFLDSRLLSDEFVKGLKDIYISGFMENEELAVFAFFQNLDYKMRQIILPSYERIYEDEYREFCSKLKNSIIDKRFKVGTKYKLEKLWIQNTVENFPYTVSTGNILNLSEKVFRGKPAILVASGPSLDEEIENLRRIKQEGLAYIFTAGSAIFKLLKHGIIPDAVCAIDAGETNNEIYKALLEDPQNNVPLIYADMMYSKVVSGYNARLFNVIMEGNSMEAYYLRYKKDNMRVKTVRVGPSVAIVALQILHGLGCDPIILAGQNLALKGDYYYAAGMDFNKNREAREKITEAERLKTIRVEDVNGNMIYTLKDLDVMRRSMEILIKYYSIDNIINTSKGGAKISGTRYMPLSDLMKERLNVTVVDPHWYDIESECYDLDYVKEQQRLMVKEYGEIGTVIEKLEKEISKIEKAVLANNERKLNALLLDFSKVIKQLTRNKFYEIFVFPMNSLQVELIAKGLAKIAKEDDLIKKGKQALKEYKEFVTDVKRLIKEVEPYFQKFDEKLQNIAE